MGALRAAETATQTASRRSEAGRKEADFKEADMGPRMADAAQRRQQFGLQNSTRKPVDAQAHRTGLAILAHCI
jgi:hypothetical protein